MALARQKTTVGHLSGRGGKKKRAPAMRKVTKRGAYKKRQKRNFINKRAAVVETKRKTREELRVPAFWSGTDPSSAGTTFADRMAFNVTDTEIVHINPQTYFWWSQGLDQAQHIGQSVTVKHLNQKVQVRFPQHGMNSTEASPRNLVVPPIPMKYTLYWGWIPAPRCLTGNTSPSIQTETVSSLDSYVNNRVKDYFNDRKDRLRFIPKKDVTIRIIGSKTVQPDLRHTSTAPLRDRDAAGDKYVHGTIPDWYGNITWKFGGGGRKLWLEQAVNMNGSTGEMIGMMPNYGWLPFCCLVNWNHSELSATNRVLYCPAVSSNDIVYFTDS
jgi:hypothetical protein